MNAFQLSLRSLLRKPRRTALTVAGVALAAATYMLLIWLGQSLVREIQSTVNLLGSELTVQQAGVGFPEMSWVTREQMHDLQTIPHVTGSTTVAITVSRLYGGAHFFIFGLGPGTPEVPGMEIVSGRKPQPGAAEVMFGRRAAEMMGLEVGQVVEMRRRRLTVVGIFDTGRSLLDRGAIFPIALVQDMFRLGDRANLVFLELDSAAHRDRVQEEIASRFPELEASPTDSWTSLYRQVATVDQFVERLALVAMLITILAVSNVLTFNVSERTQEIGVLRATGWRRWRLAATIVGEGTALATLGAIIAVPLAKLVILSLPLISTLGFADDPRIPLHAIVGGIGLTMLAGALGSLPAVLHVLRVLPAEALRAQ
ncbi:MAG TPA: ABC transporter permease [Thermoanaerobaculales bacterium]|nr:ABC transporter permease [Thermoanaerobaculales bacterium]